MVPINFYSLSAKTALNSLTWFNFDFPKQPGHLINPIFLKTCENAEKNVSALRVTASGFLPRPDLFLSLFCCSQLVRVAAGWCTRRRWGGNQEEVPMLTNCFCGSGFRHDFGGSRRQRIAQGWRGAGSIKGDRHWLAPGCLGFWPDEDLGSIENSILATWISIAHSGDNTT